MRKVSSAVLIPQKLSTSAAAAGDVDSLPTPVAFNADPFNIIVAVSMFVKIYKKQYLKYL